MRQILAPAFLAPQTAALVVVITLVVAALGVVLYRHIERLQDQQTELKEHVKHQQQKATTYRREFEKTQNQLAEVKREIDEQETSSSDDERAVENTAPSKDENSNPEHSPAQATPQTPADESSSPSPEMTGPVDETVRAVGPPTIASVVEDTWGDVQTHSAVLNIVDSEPVVGDETRLKATFRDVLRELVGYGPDSEQSAQVYTSRAITLRAQHMNPQSDVALKGDGGAQLPRRRSKDRKVVQVGTTERGLYIECTPTLVARDGSQNSCVRAVQQHLSEHGWEFDLRRTGNGMVRIDLSTVGAPRATPA